MSDSKQTNTVQWSQASKGGTFGKTPDVGQVIEGYLVGFQTSKGKFGSNNNPIIRSNDGTETILNENGNLKYLMQDVEKEGGSLGSYIRIERRPDYMHKKTNKMSKYYDLKVATNVAPLDFSVETKKAGNDF